MYTDIYDNNIKCKCNYGFSGLTCDSCSGNRDETTIECISRCDPNHSNPLKCGYDNETQKNIYAECRVNPITEEAYCDCKCNDNASCNTETGECVCNCSKAKLDSFMVSRL